MTREIWKPVDIPGFERHYSVSDRGRVRREIASSGTKCLILLPVKTGRSDHVYIYFSVDQNKTGVLLARLVARIFIGPPPSPTSVVRYRDDNRSNCRVSNLYWGSKSSVSAHKGRQSASAVANTFGLGQSTVYRLWATGSPNGPYTPVEKS